MPWSSVGPAFGAVFSTSGDVTINADRVVIFTTSGIIAPGPGHSVTIQPVSSAWAIDLGSITDAAATTLELADAELDRIFTPTLRIGSTSEHRRHHRQRPDHARGQHHRRCRCAPAAPSSTAPPGSRPTSPSPISPCGRGHRQRRHVPGHRGVQSCVQQLRDRRRLHQRCRQLDDRRRRWACVVIEQRRGRGGIHSAGPLTVAAPSWRPDSQPARR